MTARPSGSSRATIFRKSTRRLRRRKSPAGRIPSRHKKAGEGLPLRLFQGARSSARLTLLQLKNLILDAELLALQIGDRVVVGKRTMDLLIDGAFERCVLLSERLDAILHRHACPP